MVVDLLSDEIERLRAFVRRFGEMLDNVKYSEDQYGSKIRELSEMQVWLDSSAHSIQMMDTTTQRLPKEDTERREKRTASMKKKLSDLDIDADFDNIKQNLEALAASYVYRSNLLRGLLDDQFLRTHMPVEELVGS